ncbi:DMT family transporter [Neobacillus ginsengisoli]|uniref:Drug/metabolite transporter (DMT)-like permease n=1 Tax=Neobacillus ginsengisoli TaxID=904295 RepID=A0ABT9XS92_9BACI|nr:DMT family transporter [Neobacillus ginsengisoli]MDQ0198427.1 drug/metabolite transporter (DMT)-like permease [Neobacillus ginsengisoli]
MGKLYSALFVLSLIWGTSFLFIKVLLLEMGPSAVVFGRCLFGTLMLLVILLLSKRKIKFKQIPWLSVLIVALTNNTLPWLLICTSETRLSSGMASIINATTPIWTLIIGFLFFSLPLKKNQWVGILIGFIGIFILSDFKLGDLYKGNTIGILLMTGATFCYGLGAQLSKKYLSTLSVIETSFFTLAVSTVISFIMMMLLTPQSLSIFLNVKLLVPLLGLGSFGSGIAYLLYYFLVKRGSPEFASLVTYLVPVSAIIWGGLLLNEEFHLYMLIGLLVIFIGVYISSLKSKRKSNESAVA